MHWLREVAALLEAPDGRIGEPGPFQDLPTMEDDGATGRWRRRLTLW